MLSVKVRRRLKLGSWIARSEERGVGGGVTAPCNRVVLDEGANDGREERWCYSEGIVSSNGCCGL